MQHHWSKRCVVLLLCRGQWAAPHSAVARLWKSPCAHQNPKKQRRGGRRQVFVQQWLQTQALQDQNKPDPDERDGLYWSLLSLPPKICELFVFLFCFLNRLICSRWRSKPAPQRGSFRTVSIKLMLLLCESWRWGRLWAIIFWCLKCTTSSSSQSRWREWHWNALYNG